MPDLSLNQNPELSLALRLLNNTCESYFLTGRAGTGKSSFIKLAQQDCKKSLMVLAPTGIAALNVGGSTIHSFFEFPNRPMLPEDTGIKSFWQGSEKRNMIQALDTLIIDEISMVRADVVDAIDSSLRINGGNPNLPFGGKQLIFVGDIFQLEPIVSKANSEQRIISKLYEGPQFYQAKVFEHWDLTQVELNKVYRQSDPDFIRLLDKVRQKEISDHELSLINQRVGGQAESVDSEMSITLTTRKDTANRINEVKLLRLGGKSASYEAKLEGKFDKSSYPNELELELKQGAQVIFVKNDPEKRWFNGTLATVTQLTNDGVTVETADGSSLEVEPQNWNNTKYQFDQANQSVSKKTIGSFKQYPLKLAWAITIHKSQGMTFEKAIIDLGTGAFSSGQTYVALSRVTSLKGLSLTRAIRHKDIIVDSSSKSFTKAARKQELSNDNLNSLEGEYRLLQSKTNDEMALHYLTNASMPDENVNIDTRHNDLLKIFRFLTNPEIIFNNETRPFWTNLNQVITKSGISPNKMDKLSFIRGLINIGLGNYQNALDELKDWLSGKNKELGCFLMSYCHMKQGAFDQSLDWIEKALKQIGNTRNYFLKSAITNPYLYTDQNDLTNKTVFIENLIRAFLLDEQCLATYEWLMKFNKDGGDAVIDLPSELVFSQKLEERDNDFFTSLRETIRKNRRKLIRKSTGINISYQLTQQELPTADHYVIISDSDEADPAIGSSENGYYEDNVNFDEDGFIDLAEEEG